LPTSRAANSGKEPIVEIAGEALLQGLLTRRNSDQAGSARFGSTLAKSMAAYLPKKKLLDGC
jgi:hypothetical protein